MPVAIEHIRSRAEQGVTRPFLCRGDDAGWYYVKGYGAGRRSLLCEWIVGRLAQAFGLPVAPFAVVDVPEALILTGLPMRLEDLGAGPAFGSQRVELTQEISVSHVPAVAPALQRDILVFDWWVHNLDRTLTDQGGNPNLLWHQEKSELVVIDHNLAFDPDFDPDDFFALHIFAGQAEAVFNDLAEQANYIEKMEALLPVFDTACNEAPAEWWWEGEGVPVNFDVAAAKVVLQRCLRDDFWRMTR